MMRKTRLIYVASWLTPKGYDADRLRSDVVYARRSVLRERLPAISVMTRTASCRSRMTLDWHSSSRLDLQAQAVCLRLWMEARGEDVSALSDDGNSRATSYSHAHMTRFHTGEDGSVQRKTGELFSQPVTVGIII